MGKEKNIGFIGAGKMGEAMISGLIEAGYAARGIRVLEIDAARRDYIVKTYKVNMARSMTELVKLCEAIVVAVKPGSVDAVLAGLDWLPGAKSSPLIISIVAGVPVRKYLDALGEEARLVRAMPNTPALVRAGISGYFLSPGCRDKDCSLAREILQAVGPCLELADESLLDAVTGLSGSGPAYVYVMIEALADAGVMMGLTRVQALALAAHTVAGAARMVIETGQHPGVLKDQVTSPGGTTAAGLFQLEKGAFRAALQEAVRAATLRSRELGQAQDKKNEK